MCTFWQAIEETKGHVEKKQALTYEEMEAEREEEEVAAESESEDDEQAIYNPLKLPMGWDGKPIPYWLYKLHGLGQEFKCEICGNYSYWGRRAFERHFKEWRHQHGMRCLGIPNTKNFHEITSIKVFISHRYLVKEGDCCWLLFLISKITGFVAVIVAS
jgi:splicing factor 3A subunit 3